MTRCLKHYKMMPSSRSSSFLVSSSRILFFLYLTPIINDFSCVFGFILMPYFFFLSKGFWTGFESPSGYYSGSLGKLGTFSFNFYFCSLLFLGFFSLPICILIIFSFFRSLISILDNYSLGYSRPISYLAIFFSFLS